MQTTIGILNWKLSREFWAMKSKGKTSTGIGICLKALENTKCHLQTHTTASAVCFIAEAEMVCAPKSTETWIVKIYLGEYDPSPTSNVYNSWNSKTIFGGSNEDSDRVRIYLDFWLTEEMLHKLTRVLGDRRIPRGNGLFKKNIQLIIQQKPFLGS